MPEALSGLTNLQYLNLSVTDDHYNKRLIRLPEVISDLTELRYLNLSCCIAFIRNFHSDGFESQIDSFMHRISTLSNLEHLDLSNNIDISAVPNSLCKLKKLHTLDLSHCTNLRKIPESIDTIDSLKTLYLKGCYRISTPPQLNSSSITLPYFAVKTGDGEHSSNLVLLQQTDPDELQITRLENVKSAEEAQSVKLMEKQRLEDLKLEWTRDAQRFMDDKMLLENLVPPSSLKKLQIGGYNSVSLPSWLMGQLPNLESLVLSGMESLEEWTHHTPVVRTT